MLFSILLKALLISNIAFCSQQDLKDQSNSTQTLSPSMANGSLEVRSNYHFHSYLADHPQNDLSRYTEYAMALVEQAKEVLGGNKLDFLNPSNLGKLAILLREKYFPECDIVILDAPKSEKFKARSLRQKGDYFTPTTCLLPHNITGPIGSSGIVLEAINDSADRIDKLILLLFSPKEPAVSKGKKKSSKKNCPFGLYIGNTPEETQPVILTSKPSINFRDILTKQNGENEEREKQKSRLIQRLMKLSAQLVHIEPGKYNSKAAFFRELFPRGLYENKTFLHEKIGVGLIGNILKNGTVFEKDKQTALLSLFYGSVFKDELISLMTEGQGLLLFGFLDVMYGVKPGEQIAQILYFDQPRASNEESKNFTFRPYIPTVYKSCTQTNTLPVISLEDPIFDKTPETSIKKPSKKKQKKKQTRAAKQIKSLENKTKHSFVVQTKLTGKFVVVILPSPLTQSEPEETPIAKNISESSDMDCELDKSTFSESDNHKLQDSNDTTNVFPKDGSKESIHAFETSPKPMEEQKAISSKELNIDNPIVNYKADLKHAEKVKFKRNPLILSPLINPCSFWPIPSYSSYAVKSEEDSLDHNLLASVLEKILGPEDGEPKNDIFLPPLIDINSVQPQPLLHRSLRILLGENYDFEKVRKVYIEILDLPLLTKKNFVLKVADILTRHNVLGGAVFHLFDVKFLRIAVEYKMPLLKLPWGLALLQLIFTPTQGDGMRIIIDERLF